MSWVKTQLSFAILRATNLSVHGSGWNGVAMEDWPCRARSPLADFCNYRLVSSNFCTATTQHLTILLAGTVYIRYVSLKRTLAFSYLAALCSSVLNCNNKKTNSGAHNGKLTFEPLMLIFCTHLLQRFNLWVWCIYIYLYIYIIFTIFFYAVSRVPAMKS